MILKVFAAPALLLFAASNAAAQGCVVPNTLTNGTSADATAVMQNFNALAGCINAPGGPPPQGRLTLQSGVPVMTTSQTAKTVMIYTPYVGNLVPIYNGTNMVLTTFTELSVATTDTAKSPSPIGANKVNDWFVWNDGGTIRLSHGPDWTNDTTRSVGTALALVNGIGLNNASITNGPAAQRGTYVGTTRSNGSSQIDYTFGSGGSGGGAAFFGVWNCYNRVTTGTTVLDVGAGYTYTSGTIRQARASAGNQISFVTGLAEDGFFASNIGRITTVGAAGAQGNFGIGLDSTTGYAVQQNVVIAPTAAAFNSSSANVLNAAPVLGLHYVAALEHSDGTNANTFDAGGGDALTALLRN